MCHGNSENSDGRSYLLFIVRICFTYGTNVCIVELNPSAGSLLAEVSHDDTKVRETN